MSDPKNAHVLTRERLEDLRLIATGATRRADGSIYEPDRNRLHWLRDHGYITVSKVQAGSTQQERRAARGVTEKGRKALAEAKSQTRYALEFRSGSYFVNVDRERGGTRAEALTFGTEKHARWWFDKFASWVWMNGGMLVPVTNAAHGTADRTDTGDVSE